jgi:hypothetical protein
VLVASAGATAELTRTVVRDGVAETKDDLYGHGVIGLDNASLVIDDCDVLGNARIGLAFQNTAAIIRRSRITKNQIGIHVQGDTHLEEVSVAPDTPAPNQVAVSSDTRFDGNQTKVGSENVSLPTVKVGK